MLKHEPTGSALFLLPHWEEWHAGDQPACNGEPPPACHADDALCPAPRATPADVLLSRFAERRFVARVHDRGGFEYFVSLGGIFGAHQHLDAANGV